MTQTSPQNRIFFDPRDLSPQERSVFNRLAREPGKAIPTVDLLNASDSDGDNAVAKVVICRIRRKLGVRIEQLRGQHGSGDGGAYRLAAGA